MDIFTGGSTTRRLSVIALAMAALCSTQLHAAETAIVVDQPDVQKLKVVDAGVQFSELLGAEVRGNAGKRIGEIEDFVIARGAYLYAVIDTSDGPLEELIDLGNDETVVIPWDQLRRLPANHQ